MNLPSLLSGLTTRATRRPYWENRRVRDTAFRATSSRRSTRSSDATRTRHARRKRRSARLSTCEQISELFLVRSTPLKKLVLQCGWFVFVSRRDLKTVTIWFQNKRQTVARSRKLQVPEGASSANASTVTSTAAMDILASESAKMTPLAVTAAATTAKPAASALSSTSATSSVQLGSDTGRSRRLERSLSLDASVSRRHQRTASSCDSAPEFLPLASSRVRLSASARDSNVFGSAQAEPSSASPDLRRPHLGLGRTGSWPIHPEDLWKHIPSSPALPALSSPDVSPDIDTPSRSSKFSVQRPRTLEWACARSAKRRRTNPDHEPVHHEDAETDSECNSMDRSDTCHPSFSISEARVPLEYYDEYPLDVVRGAVLLLGLRDTTRGLAL